MLDLAKHFSNSGHSVQFVTARTTPDLIMNLPGPLHLVSRVRGAPAMSAWQFARSAAARVEQLQVDASISFDRTFHQDFHRNMTGCHSMYEMLLPWWQKWSIRNLVDKHLEKQLYTGRSTRMFVPGSHRISAQLQGAYHQPGDRFHSIHSPADTHLFKPSPNRAAVREALCRKLHTDPKSKILLFISLNHRRKGLTALLHALEREEISLWVVGKALSPSHKELIKRMRLAHRIREVPITTSLIELYQSADWMVNPTLYDAGSQTSLQAMASGLPVIMSVMDGHVDHVRDNQNGLILYHPQEPLNIAQGIQKACELSASAYQAMSAAAVDSMRSLSWAAHIAEWEHLFQKRPRI